MNFQPYSHEIARAWMMDSMMYGYIPVEYFRETAPDLESDPTTAIAPGAAAASASDSASDAGIPWGAILLALVLGGLGFSTVVTSERMGEAVSLHAKQIVADMGLPTSWKF